MSKKKLEVRIVLIGEKTMVGMQEKMSLSQDNTFSLWKSFRSKEQQIDHRISSDLFSIQIYDENTGFDNFTPKTIFEKWAAVEVSMAEDLPEGCSSMIIPQGLYAVFVHRGTPDMFPETMTRIMKEWFPASAYVIDQRPHFAVMGEDYKLNDPRSEEEIWIPVRLKLQD